MPSQTHTKEPSAEQQGQPEFTLPGKLPGKIGVLPGNYRKLNGLSIKINLLSEIDKPTDALLPSSAFINCFLTHRLRNSRIGEIRP
jgi:hypothetical protein